MENRSVSVRLLGGFAISVDGIDVPLRWPGRRAGELVQLLALAPAQRLLRDQAIDALWPHLDAAAGAANLRKAAHLARQGLADPTAVVLRRGWVMLFPDADVSTDVAAFSATAEEALHAADPAAARAAAELYPGDLLPESPYEDWAGEPRHRLRQRFLALLRLAGNWAHLAEEDPTDEEAARFVMDQDMAAGRRHLAIARYAQLRSVLQRDLGVLPSLETEETYRRCLADLPARPDPVFVGRAPEVALAEAHLGRVGRAAVVAVRGPGGIGKTAFASHLASRAAGSGWQVVRVAAFDPARSYAALGAAVEQAVVGQPALIEALGDKTRAVLGEICPAVTARVPLEVPLSRHQVIGAAHRVFAGAAGPAGLLVVVDNAHLADAASVDAFLQLGDSGPQPVALLWAYREESAPEPLRTGMARASRAPWALVIDLAPLDPAGIAALAIAAEPALDAGAIDDIVGRCDGNPFFALELAHQSGTSRERRDIRTVRDALVARFVGLDEATSAMLRRLALVGVDLDLTRVLALTGLAEPEAAALLDHALAAGVLVVADGAYRFRHDLVREALADQLPPHQRVAIHRDAARRLADAGAAPSVVARHWLDGGRPAQALPWLLDAARDAMRLSGYTTALGHLDALLVHRPDHPEALLLRARALDALGDIRALAAYTAAAAATDETGRHEIVPHQALAQIKMGDPAGALVTLGDSRPTGLEARLARALTLSGAAALGFGDPAVGSAEAAEGRRLAFASGDPSAVVVASWAQAAAAHARGELRASLLTDLMDTHALPKLAVTVFDGQICINQRLLYGARPYQDVIAFAETFAAEARRLDAARGYAFALTLRGEARLLSGDLARADRDLEEAWRFHRDMHGTTGESFSLQRRAEVALAQGRHADARLLLDRSLDVARESDIGFHLLDRIYGTRIALTLATHPSEAAAALDEAEVAVRGPVETCPGCRITLAFPAALAAAAAGDHDRLTQYEQACEFLAEVVMRLPAWDAALIEVRAHQALLEGDRATARARFTDAARRYAAAGHPLDRIRCERSLAAVG